MKRVLIPLFMMLTVFMSNSAFATHWTKPAASSSTMHVAGDITIDGAAAQVNDEVAIFNTQSQLIGWFLINTAGQYGDISVNGFVSSAPDVPGANAGDALTVKVWSASRSKEYSGSEVAIAGEDIGAPYTVLSGSTLSYTAQAFVGFKITATAAPSAPGAPTIGTATAGNGQASVSFTAPTFNGNSAITGYTVTSNPGGLTGTGTASPIVVPGLANGTAYTFTVTATNAIGTSAASAASNSVTPVSVPDAPVIGTATGGNGQASVAFTTPANNGGSAITVYTVTVLQAGQTVKTVTGTQSPIVVTGLTNGTAYTFTVTASNANGASIASAASNSVTPATVPGAPTQVSATAGNGRATVTFAAPTDNGGAAITGYTVASNPAGGTDSNAGSTGTSHLITGLVNGTEYSFTVVATNSAGNSAASAASNPVTPQATVPDAPSIANAAAGNAQVTVTITPPANDGGSAITGYRVIASTAGAPAANAVDSNSGTTATVHVITGLTNDTAYTFTAIATNAKGDSQPSAASAAVTPRQLGINIGAPTSGTSQVSLVKAGATVTFALSAVGPAGTTVNLTDAMVSLNSVGINGATGPTGTVSVSNGTTATPTVTVSNIAGDGTLGITVAEGAATASGVSSPVAKSATFIVDSTAPALTIASSTLADGTRTSNNTLSIAGTVTDANGVASLTVNGNAVTLGADGSFTTAIPLNIGANPVTVLATDNAGNQQSSSRSIIFDNTAPAVTFSTGAPADKSFTNQQTATISGTLDKPGTVTVKVNDGTAIVLPTSGAGNSFSTPVTLATGANTITLVAQDTAVPPNTATVVRSVTFDNVAPTLAITDPAQDITTSFPTYLVKGTAGDNNNQVTIAMTVDGVAVSPAPTVAADGSFQQSVNLTSAKTYQIAVTATDQAGNSSTAQRNIVRNVYTLVDALHALKIAATIDTATAADLTRLDVGPLVSGKPAKDGAVDLSDAIVLLRIIVGDLDGVTSTN